MTSHRKSHQSISDVIESRPDIVDLLDSDADLNDLFDLPSDIPFERVRLYKSLYLGIGNTPCYTAHLPNNNLLRIKMEYANAMGNNHYARCWIPYLFIAETLGVIRPGRSHLLEVTSGSAGISLSMAAKYLGYRLTLIVPDMLPKGRTAPMEEYGATLIRVRGYIEKCISVLRRMMVGGDYFPCNHSEEGADILVKIDSRIMEEYCSEYGAPDYCIVGLGNGTSTYSIFHYLERAAPQSRRIAFHPDSEDHDIVYGLYRPGVKLRHVDPALDLTHERIITSGMEINKALKYFKFDSEISNLGLSSLYAILIAIENSSIVSNSTFFTIGYDKNDRYRDDGSSH